MTELDIATEHIRDMMKRKLAAAEKDLAKARDFREACQAGADAVTEWKHQKFLRGLVAAYTKQEADIHQSIGFWSDETAVREWGVRRNVVWAHTGYPSS